jgi:hypothetical protein
MRHSGDKDRGEGAWGMEPGAVRIKSQKKARGSGHGAVRSGGRSQRSAFCGLRSDKEVGRH